MINDLRRMSSGAIHAYLPRAASAIVADESRTSRDSLQTREIQEGKIELAVGTLSRFISGPINAETGVPDSVRV